MEIPQKIKISTITWLSYSTSGHLPIEHKNAKAKKKYMHACVHYSITYNSQIRKKPVCPSVLEWIKM